MRGDRAIGRPCQRPFGAIGFVRPLVEAIEPGDGFAQGDIASRFGYRNDDPVSIHAAIRDALAAAGSVAPRAFPTWDGIGERLLHPERYPDTALPGHALPHSNR